MGLLNNVYDSADMIARQKKANKKRDKAKIAAKKQL
jgi:hypothetical protein